jgi:hypothetical protein
MWCVDRPPFDAEETFAACISRVQDEDLKSRLTDIADHVKDEAASYAEHAGAGELHLVAGTPGVAGLVTTDEMVSVYDQISISAYRAKKKHALMARATMRCELAAMR